MEFQLFSASYKIISSVFNSGEQKPTLIDLNATCGLGYEANFAIKNLYVHMQLIMRYFYKLVRVILIMKLRNFNLN